tara:strand:- start:161 stop:778 length:618 start_codon:yes stop_codon:yes gene_type:complete
MNKIFNFSQFSEPWDQKIAKVLSKPFIFFNIHPNFVTLIGTILGLFTFYFYSKGDLFFAKIGSVIFFFGACCDHIDGEVARKLNKTSILGHYLDHLGVCITYVALFLGLGVWCQINTGKGYYYGIIASFSVFMIMSLRFYLERNKGGGAIKQKNFLGFEPEDILYLIIPITFLGKIESFLYAAYIGTPIFLLITIFIVLYKIKKL